MNKRNLIIGGAAAGLLVVVCACLAAIGLIASPSKPVAIAPTRTPLPPLATATPLPPPPSPSPLPSPTNSPPPVEPSPTSTSPAEEIPSPTAAQDRSPQIGPSVVAGPDTVNLRAGPGKDYPLAGSLPGGQSLPIIGRNADSSWWQVTAPSGPAWVSASVISTLNTNDTIPVVEAPPAPAPAATSAQADVPAPAPQPTVAATSPVPADSQCDCSANLYNCNDGSFSSDAEAQGCYLHCIQAGAGDVHDLDRDHDGNACEWGK